MQRKLPDVSTTQLIASGIATGAAAIGASYLGVYGTIIGAAFMSVVSTAGAAVGKHYLDQGKEQIKERTHLHDAVQDRETARSAAEEATSADPTRTVAWPAGAAGAAGPAAGDPNATRMDPSATRMDPSATSLDPVAGGDPNATRLDRSPAETVAGSLAADAGEEAIRDAARRSAWESTVVWAKRRWGKLVLASAAVFVIVIGGISLYEWATGTPIGNNKDKGTSVGNVFGGGGPRGQDDSPSPGPSVKPSESGDSPDPGKTGGQSGTPSSPSSTPPPAPPTGQPTGRPTKQPTGTPTPTPSAPQTKPPADGQEPGNGQEGADQQGRADTPGS